MVIMSQQGGANSFCKNSSYKVDRLKKVSKRCAVLVDSRIIYDFSG